MARDPRPRKAAFLIIGLFTLFGTADLPGGTPDSRRNNGKTSLPLTVIAIGDIGESGGPLRNNAETINEMYTGAHDGGVFQLMIFLGDNFYPTGLNVPTEDVNGKVRSILGPFRPVLSGLGRSNVHAIPGNHDWYARNALEKSLLLGLVNISTGPIGLTEKGNLRAQGLDEWTYHYRMPAEAVYPLGGTSQDSAQFLFFDSSLLLRTDPATWHASLDSLRKILQASRGRPGITWRIMCVHHPFYSVGEHGGFSVWDDESQTVAYTSNCDKDSNALGFVKNWLDPEDLCSQKYRRYVDSLKVAVRAAAVDVQVLLAGHDHSLQLLYYPERDREYAGWPKVHIVSGAGSTPSRVKFPAPPHEYTSAQTRPEKEGYSTSGFAQLHFEGDKLRVIFFEASIGEVIDMGSGKKEFWIDREGRLLSEKRVPGR